MCGGVILVGAAIVLAVLTLYYGSMLTGLIKDPLMAQFRQYGEETRLYPLLRFLRALGILCLVLSFVLSSVQLVTPALMVLGLIALLIEALLERDPRLGTILPRWYADLMAETTREERRALAFAWLRMGFKTRLRLNSDSYAFRAWTDEVRVTVIYGARDPSDPWLMWQ